MTLRFRKPELLPTLVMIVIVAFCLRLATWQIERLEWKEALLAEITQAQSQPPRELLSYEQGGWEKAEWRNATVTGTLLHDRELIALPRYLKGKLGYAVLTPLEIATPEGPRYLIVNRGWVDKEHKPTPARADGNPAEKVTVEGVIRTGFKPGTFTPDNKPAEGFWFWYDLPAMSEALKLPLLPVLLDVSAIRLPDGSELKKGPVPFPLEITIRNDHAGYAVTWLLIGLAALVMFGAYYRERSPAEGAPATRR